MGPAQPINRADLAMFLTSNVGGVGSHPARSDGERLVASLDVEWTKNYRVRNGNRVFAYSVVWLSLLDGHDVDPETLPFGFTSVYLELADDCRDLVTCAAADLSATLRKADFMVGHQLCADLGVLAANAVPPGTDLSPMVRESWTPVPVAKARSAWHARNDADPKSPRVIDTRFDTDPILAGRSRRLVDVCTELGLDVTQPELGHRSMTALHREWIDHGDVEARERITVLNLRHSLSAALVALRLLGIGGPGHLDVNRLLDRQLRGTFGWIDHPTFRALVR